MTFDILGNTYVSDSYNYRIPFFLPEQLNSTTIADVTGVSSANGSLLSSGGGVALDTQLNMYVADFWNRPGQKFVRY